MDCSKKNLEIKTKEESHSNQQKDGQDVVNNLNSLKINAVKKTTSENSRTNPNCIRKSPSESKTVVQPIEGTRTDEFFASLPGSEKDVVDCTVVTEYSCGTGIAEQATLKIFSNRKRNYLLLTLNLSEVTCLMNKASPPQPAAVSLPTIKNIKGGTSPLILYSTFTSDFEGWLRCISMVWEFVHDVPKIPRERSIWGTTELEDVYVTDKDSLRKIQNAGDGLYKKEFKYLSIGNRGMVLPNGFSCPTEVTINCSVKAKVVGNEHAFHTYLIDNDSPTSDIALYLRWKFDESVISHNSFVNKNWGTPKEGEKFNQDENNNFTLTIRCMEKQFQIILNGAIYSTYPHRISPDYITHIKITGNINVDSILYKSNNVIFDAQDLVWRKIDGKLRKVATTSVGVTWGINSSGLPVVYCAGKSDAEKDWFNVGSMKLTDLSLGVFNNSSEPKTISVWAIDEKGDVFYRYGVTTREPLGTKWECIKTSIGAGKISYCGVTGHVWYAAGNGQNNCYWRFGITVTNPVGESWKETGGYYVCPVDNVVVGKWTVWIQQWVHNRYDRHHRTFVRKGITPLNPGGGSWDEVYSEPNGEIQHIFGSENNIWAITQGELRRLRELDYGSRLNAYWNCGLNAKWNSISE